MQFFHPGLYYDRTVAINVVDAKGVQPVAFSPSQFDYGKNDFASRVPQDLGYAGFRIHYPIKTPNYYDEVIVFLGASYFRAVGKQQVFGLSARGLAIDTGAAVRRGVSRTSRSSGWSTPGAEGEGADRLRAARQPEPHRRLPLRRPARRADQRRRRSRASSSAAR